jgi:hypothetical protein
MYRRRITSDPSRADMSRGMAYRRRMTAASSHEIARYMKDETIARIVIAVITMLSLKI